MPIIGCKISGIPIDFLMARLELSTIPDDLSLQDDNLLRHLDDFTIRSLNGMPSSIVRLRISVDISLRFARDGRDPPFGTQCCCLSRCCAVYQAMGPT